MKESEKDKISFLAGEAPDGKDGKGLNREKLKKPVVFGLMGILFAACLYLIFAKDTKEQAKDALRIGINDAVPQASEDALPADKGKAYEQEMLNEKERQKREALMTLSDYWQVDSTARSEREAVAATEETIAMPSSREANPALGSYRNMQQSLGSFYRKNPEQDALRKENENLRAELERQSAPQDRGLDRLQLMEKSYQMAAKYFPGATKMSDTLTRKHHTEKEQTDFVEVLPEQRPVVSRLAQHFSLPSDGERPAVVNYTGFIGFAETGLTHFPANSIRACIHQTVKITGDGTIQLRLLQPARLAGVTLPAGHILTANSKFQTSRLQLQVVSLEVEGRIIPVSLSAYDLDGQKGLHLPYAPEVTAVNGTLANMGNTAGGSFTINRSAGQQLTSDATRGLIQGVSGYFSKKVKPQKAIVKAGYQLFLISEDQ